MKKFAEEGPTLLGLGLSRRWEAAAIGALASLLVSLLFWRFTPLTWMFFGASIIPTALIGSLLVSKKPIQRIIGIILLVIFIAAWLYFAFLFVMMMD